MHDAGRGLVVEEDPDEPSILKSVADEFFRNEGDAPSRDRRGCERFRVVGAQSFLHRHLLDFVADANCQG